MQYPVFVISLVKDEARRENLKKQFLSYDKFEIIEAVNGNEIGTKNYFDIIINSLDKHSQILSPNEVGCTLSHIKAYERFLQIRDATHCLILEDDCLGNDECIKKAFEIASNLPQNSFFHCCGLHNKSAKKRIAVKKVQDGVFLVNKFFYDKVFATCAYIVDKPAAQKILQTHQNAITSADNYEELLLKNGINLYYSRIFGHCDEVVLDSNIRDERSIRIKIQKKKIKGSIKSKNLWQKIQKYYDKYIRCETIMLDRG